MSDVERLTREGVGASERKGFWVHAGDFNQKIEQGLSREAELQQRLTAADERNDVAIDLLQRARAVIEGGGWADLERDIGKFLNSYKGMPDGPLTNDGTKQAIRDALKPAEAARPRGNPTQLNYGSLDAAQRLAVCRGEMAPPVSPERERLMEIVEQYPNVDPLEYDAAVRTLRK